MSKCSASWAIVRSPLTAASATFALKAAEWFRRGRLFMVSPVHGDYRRCQAEIPLIVLSRFPGPALWFAHAEDKTDARFSRCKDHGADPARIPHHQGRHHPPQRESGTGFQNAGRFRLEYLVSLTAGRPA